MDALRHALDHAERHLARIPDAPVGPPADLRSLRAALGGPTPEAPTDEVTVIDDLVAGATPGIVASPGPRYFGFVTGGATPAALAADVMTSVWDQNTAFAVMSPAAAVIEEVAAGWLCDLLGLPDDASVGFVTGAQMANVTCLLAARHRVLDHTGWDDRTQGLIGAPPVRIVAGDEAHVTLHVALRYIGLGAPNVIVPSDGQGAMRADALAEALAGPPQPTIVCAQAGNVNTGASDPFDALADVCAQAGAWLHVDGAFGLWAAAAPGRRHLVAGHERADSWATDGHKWLNVPYDSGVAITRDPDAHRAAMSMTAAYLVTDAATRDGSDWAPESSRRARAIPIWAAIRALGRHGIAELVERNCLLAARMASTLAEQPGVEILNDVVLNQALVRFTPANGGDANHFTQDVIRRVQADGTCWVGGTVWRGRSAMRISVSNWSTTEADADRSVEAIVAAARSLD